MLSAIVHLCSTTRVHCGPAPDALFCGAGRQAAAHTPAGAGVGRGVAGGGAALRLRGPRAGPAQKRRLQHARQGAVPAGVHRPSETPGRGWSRAGHVLVTSPLRAARSMRPCTSRPPGGSGAMGRGGGGWAGWASGGSTAGGGRDGVAIERHRPCRGGSRWPRPRLPSARPRPGPPAARPRPPRQAHWVGGCGGGARLVRDEEAQRDGAPEPERDGPRRPPAAAASKVPPATADGAVRVVYGRGRCPGATGGGYI